MPSLSVFRLALDDSTRPFQQTPRRSSGHTRTVFGMLGATKYPVGSVIRADVIANSRPQ